ncbi:MAG: TraB/GumN family protein [Pseudomonadales bacterium]|nr:TraB/GumN family protein [Pseudomonadales bacterium]
MTWKLFFLCFTLLFSGLSAAQTSVWKVSKDGGYFYLAGTMHVLKAEDYPLPAAFETAYKDASQLILEVDLSADHAAEFQQKLSQNNFYQKGENLKSVLNDEAWQVLKTYCKERGLPINVFMSMPIGIVVTTIAMAELMQLGISQQGVDAYFNGRAVADKKTVTGLETADQQLDFLLAMGRGDESHFVLQNLQELASLEQDIQQLRDAWRAGDIQKLDALMIQDMQKNYPDVYQQLLVQRNNNWLPKIKALVETKEIEYVLVGAAHIAGRDGLHAQLRKAGFTIEQLKK